MTQPCGKHLLQRLGYDRYGVHGGDIGARVSGMVAGVDAERVIGVHIVTDPYTAASTPPSFRAWPTGSMRAIPWTG